MSGRARATSARHKASPPSRTPVSQGPRAGSPLGLTAGADLVSLQRLAGNQAVVQLLAAPTLQREPALAAPHDVDPRARVDQLELAITLEIMNKRFKTDLDKAVEALSGLTPEEGRAVKLEYKRRTKLELADVLLGQQNIGRDDDLTMGTNLGAADQKRLLNLAAGTVAPTADPANGQAAAEFVGGVVSGAATLLGHGEEADELGQQVATSVVAGTKADEARQAAAVAASRNRAEAAQLKAALDDAKSETVIGLIRRPAPERQVLAEEYQRQFGAPLLYAITLGLKDPLAVQRATAIWIGDTVLADRIALQGDLASQQKVDAAAKEVEDSLSIRLTNPVMIEVAKRQQKAAKAQVEARLATIAAADQPDTTEGRAASREHLAAVLQGPAAAGGTLGAQIGAIDDPVAKAIVEQGEPEELAARMARADGEGSLKAGELEKALRQLRTLARGAAIRQIQHDQSLVPQAEHVIEATVADYYQRFQRRFDAVDSKRPLDKALSLGDDEDEERNRALVAYSGSMPPWRELDLALRQHPRDMDRVRTILNNRDQPDIAAIAADYHEHTIGHRSLETDLLGTPEQQMIARYKDKDKANAEIMEGRVLLGGGVFTSDSTDEATRLDEERRWTFGRFYALERAVIQNRGTFAELRDWVGNIEKGLVDRADQDATDASGAMANALLAVPPDLATARAALADLRRATRRLEHNLDVYKEATKAAFNEFVDFAVLAVTTIVTLGEGSAIILAIRATAATIGTKLVLKGDDYSVDEFLMDLRSGVGAAVGGKLAEGVLKPIAGKVAAYATESGLSRTFGGKVLGQLGKAADWEAGNLTNTAAVNIATGQDVTKGMGASDHMKNLAIHGITTSVKAGRGGRATAGTETGEGRAGEEAVRPADEDSAAPRTGEETAAPGTGEETARSRTEEVAGVAGAGPSGRQGPVDTSDPWAGGPAPEEAATAVDGPVTEPVPHTSMALPEPAAAAAAGKPTARRQNEHASEAAEEPPDLLDDFEDAPDTRDDIRVENPRQRTNRELQERREARRPGDAASLRTSTGVDARAAGLAAKFAPLYAKWSGMEPTARLAEIKRIVNETLEGSGAPGVEVRDGVPEAHRSGKAEFDVETWEITLDRNVIENGALTVEQFSALVDNATHEARHALHHFRGLRAALSSGEFVEGSALKPNEQALAAAREANEGSGKPMQETAYGEALEVYRQTFGPGAEHRVAVKATLKSANASLRAAVAARDGLPEGSAERAAAEQVVQSQLRRATEAHNAYMALPQETDAWRTGTAVRRAVTEQVLGKQVSDAKAAKRQAEADQRAANRRRRGSASGSSEATTARAEAAAAAERVAKETDRITDLEQQLKDAAQQFQEPETPADEIPEEDEAAELGANPEPRAALSAPPDLPQR